MKKKDTIPILILAIFMIILTGYYKFKDNPVTIPSAARSKTSEIPDDDSLNTGKQSDSKADHRDEIDTLSKKEMYDDYDAMWKNIEANYLYMGVVKRTTGNDFSKIKSTYRNKINDISNTYYLFCGGIRCF